ncbi:MAG: NADH:flavin oxidoreductase [Proteobacteria bacterium]|nr:MAG: NADH:flavin oxidoreductase [Pseudomonadota bacterium]
MSERWPRVASLRTPAALRARLAAIGAELPCDDAVETGADAPLARPLALGDGPRGALGASNLVAPNRFAVQPMEGWDGSEDGNPGELTLRRWRRFGASGAGWIWGGEAVAVRADGRANPHQLVAAAHTERGLAALREALLGEARRSGHPAPVVGLQLTHSGRWSVPEPGRRRPRVAYRHPILDARVGIADDAAVLADGEVDALIDDFARAAALAERCGYDFVDVKHCHGYLLHEFLSARTRTGRWGGPSLADRTRLAFATIDAVRAAAPRLAIGVRLSLFDVVPHRRGAHGRGEPEPHPTPYGVGFGIDAEDPSRIDLAEPIAFVQGLAARGVRWVNVTSASPYYAPHAQRPALFPPSDGYPPPEDPLAGVARLLGAARALKQAVPDAIVLSSGWTYLQEWISHVAQACLRDGWFDAVGLGRMALSYPELPADALAGRALARGKLCRTFSDCTTAPRNGLVSGCYPLDGFYRERPEHAALEAAKRKARA